MLVPLIQEMRLVVKLCTVISILVTIIFLYRMMHTLSLHPMNGQVYSQITP